MRPFALEIGARDFAFAGYPAYAPAQRSLASSCRTRQAPNLLLRRVAVGAHCLRLVDSNLHGDADGLRTLIQTRQGPDR
jgi:hypothetical protein